MTSSYLSEPVLSCADLRAIEANAQTQGLTLMERAGAAAAEYVQKIAHAGAGPILILCGPGNNGGDGFVLARLLKQTGYRVDVVCSADTKNMPTDAQNAYQAWCDSGGEVSKYLPPKSYALIVDALFGIGLTRAVEGIYARWIEYVNSQAIPVLALDIPSGLNADAGAIAGGEYGCVLHATYTLSFIALKPGLLTLDGPDACGTIKNDALQLENELAKYLTRTIGLDLFSPCLRPRARNSHKGSFGNAAIIGGTTGMVGAALLAGRAALHIGAGRVFVSLLDTRALSVDVHQPELMLQSAEHSISAATAIAIGPGLGQSKEASQLLEECVAQDKPLVCDADALNLIAQNSNLADQLCMRKAATLLTPHPAEAARLLRTTTTEIQSNRIQSAQGLAKKFNAHIVLKGCGSIVCEPNGNWYINTSGNPGMASAGMGDVLTGILCSILAQGWSARDALLAGVHLHGRAADLCVAENIGPIGLCAGEVIQAARRIFNQWCIT